MRKRQRKKLIRKWAQRNILRMFGLKMKPRVALDVIQGRRHFAFTRKIWSPISIDSFYWNSFDHEKTTV